MQGQSLTEDMAYTNQTNVERYLGFALSAGQAAALSAWIAAVEAWINNYTGTVFEEVASSDRYFDGNGQKEMIVDEFHGTPTIVFLDQNGDVSDTLDSDDFYAYPLNDTVKNRIVLADGGAHSRIPSGTRRVKITATWGHSAVPKPIELAATKMVAGIIRDEGKGTISEEHLGEWGATYKLTDEKVDLMGIESLIWQYKQMEL